MYACMYVSQQEMNSPNYKDFTERKSFYILRSSFLKLGSADIDLSFRIEVCPRIVLLRLHKGISSFVCWLIPFQLISYSLYPRYLFFNLLPAMGAYNRKGGDYFRENTWLSLYLLDNPLCVFMEIISKTHIEFLFEHFIPLGGVNVVEMSRFITSMWISIVSIGGISLMFLYTAKGWWTLYIRRIVV